MKYRLEIHCDSDLSADAVSDRIAQKLEEVFGTKPLDVSITPTLGMTRKEIIINAVISVSMSVAGNFATDAIKARLEASELDQVKMQYVEVTKAPNAPLPSTPAKESGGQDVCREKEAQKGD